MATPKKKATKKAAGKHPWKKQSEERIGAAKPPAFKASVAANKAMTRRDALFFKLAPDSNTTIRVIPRYDPIGLESGAIFVQQKLHYTIIDGKNSGFPSPADPERKVAPACLQHHGDGNCLFCQLSEWLIANGFSALGEKMVTATQLQVQVWILDPTSKKWYGPRVINAPKTVADKLTTMISMAEDNDMPQFCDPEQGQGITVTRTGASFNTTRYDAQLTGRIMSMTDVDPDWWTKCIQDLPKKLDLKVLSWEEQRVSAEQAHPELPWDAIDAELRGS